MFWCFSLRSTLLQINCCWLLELSMLLLLSHAKGSSHQLLITCITLSFLYLSVCFKIKLILQMYTECSVAKSQHIQGQWKGGLQIKTVSNHASSNKKDQITLMKFSVTNITTRNRSTLFVLYDYGSITLCYGWKTSIYWGLRQKYT